MGDNNIIAITDNIQIPLSELEFTFSPSRGPGGQHVNRAHTRATLHFDVANSPSLDEASRATLMHELGSRLDKRGILQTSAQDTRSQSQNRELALARFIAMMSEALQEKPERKATKPSKKAKERRLEEKKKHGQLKHERGHDWSEEA